jgi:orotate phosphoribosyltransferase
LQPDIIAKQIAHHLLEIGAVLLRPDEPFTWASGIRSPIYCDNRVTLSYPAVRRVIADAFVSLIRAEYPQAEGIAGIATGGIAHAAFVAERLDLPMIYVREKPKGHGRQNQVEGHMTPGQKVVLIEDLISTGGSSLKAAKGVQAEGGDVLGVISIFNYQFPQAEKNFREAGIPAASLSNYSALLEAAKERGVITLEQEKILAEWRKRPAEFYG